MNKRLLGILAVALVFIVAAIQGNERGSTPNNERIATKQTSMLAKVMRIAIIRLVLLIN